MKKLVTLVFVVTLILGATQVFALDFGDEITIYDQNSKNENWYRDHEDQEVEPGMVRKQKWDMEAFFQDGSQLTMVAGYDFVNGDSVSYGQLMAGDLFIDVDGDAVYGDIHGEKGNNTVQERNGYDFVLDMNFDTMTYDVFQLTDDSMTITSYEKQNQGSNPWRYASGGVDLDISGTIEYQAGLTDTDTGFLGGWHNAATVDMGFLAQLDLSGYNLAETFTVHNTMECGNDNLMGAYIAPVSTAVPEPSTVLLLGLGVLGLLGLGRKRIR